MTREEKSQVIEDLTAQLADNTNIYLTDISGLDAGTTSKLRRACFKSNIKLSVVKNKDYNQNYISILYINFIYDYINMFNIFIWKYIIHKLTMI